MGSKGSSPSVLLSLRAMGMVISGLPGGSTDTMELLENPSFEDWRDGLPACWLNVTDPGAALGRSGDAMDGAHSLRLTHVRSNDVHIHQNVTVPDGLGGDLEFSLWCRIDESEDMGPKGVLPDRDGGGLRGRRRGRRFL